MPTDETLMQAVASGDLRQLTELYQRYRNPLYAYFLRRTNASAQAEDLLQNAFERVIQYRNSYRGPAFRAWLFTIARNVLHDELRKGGKFLLADGFDLGTLAHATPAPDCAWEALETLGQSRQALAGLSPGYREVVELAWQRGLKYAEIAVVLGISEANVKVRIHRATKQLRANYAKLNEQ